MSLRFFALAAALVLAACTSGSDSPRSAIALADCRLPGVETAARCGTHEVWEDRAAKAGRRLTLKVAVVPAKARAREPDPIFVIAGGPGQGAISLAAQVMPLFARLNDSRDVVFLDQRGTGESAPLDCDDDTQPLQMLFEDALPERLVTKCLAALDADPRQYVTPVAMEDLDEVRAALGYDRINLWGGSYGTRAAQEYLRRYPQQVRSVVLDGVATPAMRSTLDVWPSREVALAAILDACAQAPACAAAHPNLQTTLDGIRDRLGPEGQDVTLVDPRTGDSQSMRLTFEHVIGALQPFTYAPELAALLPEVIARAAAGDFGPLYSGAMLVTGDLDEQSNTALHYSVTCAEDVSRVTPADAASTLGSLRTKTLAERALSVCTAWPK